MNVEMCDIYICLNMTAYKIHTYIHTFELILLDTSYIMHFDYSETM